MTSAARRWAEDLAAWAIPQSILDSVTDSPWVLPKRLFAQRTERYLAAPEGASYARAVEALAEPGTVLDVGAGTGAASLPLADRTTALTAVDESAEMLSGLTERAAALGLDATTVTGRWPDRAGEVPPTDVVVCHHVLYNVPDCDAFVRALDSHARRRVVLELTAAHPLTAISPLWRRLHGLARPTGPTAEDAREVLREAGIEAHLERWTRQAVVAYASFDELVDVTRCRVCVPPERRDEVAAALVEFGVDPADPVDLGGRSRELVTLWWDIDARR